ncbi:ATP dependent helicase, Lhr family [Sanguibacter keddieii DSM 10542]|uniref:ATP dependent helicase, Lhr family n=1 Tax=Sanguibacter keddieii (strain ATCC 51767 / DSM 10542 / NCFB 3025 / ST-74) TaxID=446469 RepID=D1BJ43_SANKS|nr:ATP dependent helicase, Lhr family [Sanguibacter keddieii DSM 10542]
MATGQQDDTAARAARDIAHDPDARRPALERFSPATQAWFAGAFHAPTAAQTGTWDAVADGHHALVVAPTGSGKTLAAFLWALDGLLDPSGPEPEPPARCRVVYVSPLKALAADVERNLRSPLAGVRQSAARRGEAIREVRVGTRTGDTPASERRAFATTPPDILITTPESLFLILTSGAREGLRGVTTVILDEIHAVAGTKRGAHLAVSLERLDALVETPVQRIGLSATVTPVSSVAAFLAGSRTPADGGRTVDVVQPPASKTIEVDVVVPVPDLADLRSAPTAGATDGPQAQGAPAPGTQPPGAGGPATLAPGVPDLSGAAAGPRARPSVWPHIEERVVDLVAAHRSTLVFTNSRRGAERLTSRMNEVWAEREGADHTDPGEAHPALVQGQSGASTGAPGVLARAHHGSMSRAERTHTETELKEGRLPAVVSTSSLELGIDMGAIDLVVQIGSPPSVASGLQRIGRAGHQVGAVSHGVVFPMHRGDLVPSTVIAERMRTGSIEPVHVMRNPLDVLAQQVVAMVATEDWHIEELATVLRRADPYTTLGDRTLRAVLDMLAGRYPSEDFGELRARIVWDRVTDTLSARPGALRLAVTSGGTIPDRGLYGVFLATGASGATGDSGSPRGGKRVGELDEEMVYESRVGDTFTLGSSTWRIEDITPDQVLVSPAPGVPGRLPFWKGDSPGRPAELGRAIGAWVREASQQAGTAGTGSSTPWAGLDPWATDNLRAYLDEQREATGVVPDDKTLLVERFRDELGDWRVVIHSPYGAKVHAPWALVLAARIRERFGIDAAAMHSDDGIVLRMPDVSDPFAELPDGTSTDASRDQVDLAELLLDPEAVETAVRSELSGSNLFGARFREAAARALLLPRRRPDRRQPLWQQRHRSAQLLSVASGFPDFPIVLEAVRECLQDDFDVASLVSLMKDVEDGRVQVVEVTTRTPSPFAQSLLFGYTAQFLYDGDAPLAERRAAALTLDPDLLAELLGSDGSSQIADLLDPDAVVRTEQELSGLAPERHARHAEDLWDLLRRTGPLTTAEVVERTREDVRGEAEQWLDALAASRRVVQVRIAGVEPAERWAVAEDAGRLRDALGVALPVGLPESVTELVPDPLGDLVRRYSRTHGPFAARDLAGRYGLGVAVVADVLRRHVQAGQLVTGRLRPDVLGGTGEDYCDADVLRTLRRRSLAALRAEVEPVQHPALGVFLPRWQSVGGLRGVDGLYRVVEQLSGAPVPVSALESQILPARVVDYRPSMLDELTTSGEVLWCGHHELPGGRGAADAMISLHLADSAHLTLRPVEADDAPLTDLQAAVLGLLEASGGFFYPRLASSLEHPGPEVLAALWELVWSGHVTNDTLGPLRGRLSGRRATSRSSPAARPRPLSRRPRFSSLGATASSIREAAADPSGGGRWSALPVRDVDTTRRAHALATVLLDRHGVLTRAVTGAEQVTSEYRGVYKVLGALETAGQVRRGYFVEHLGGSQFALPGAVDQLRTAENDRVREAERTDPPTALCLAATDPAQPYGAALAWPPSPGAEEAGRSGHRPGRKAGAHVVVVRGELVLYLERGGRSLLTFSDDQTLLEPATRALALSVADGRLGKVTLRRVDGDESLTVAGASRTAGVAALVAAGFGPTPSGLRLSGLPAGRRSAGGARA